MSMTPSAPAHELAVANAAKLYEMRQYARRLFGDRYAREVADVQKIIRHVAQADGTNALKATMKLLKEAIHEHVAAAMIAAAYVEMTEGPC